MAMKIRALCLLLLMPLCLYASLDADVPEIPNIISLLHKVFKESPFITLLYRWETLVYSIITGAVISLVFYLGSLQSG